MMFNLSQSMLAGTTTAQRQQWLTDAQAAYAALMTGGKPVSVSAAGRSVTYASTDAAQLENWINTLLMSLGQLRTRRAVRPYFR